MSPGCDADAASPNQGKRRGHGNFRAQGRGFGLGVMAAFRPQQEATIPNPNTWGWVCQMLLSILQPLANFLHGQSQWSVGMGDFL